MKSLLVAITVFFAAPVLACESANCLYEEDIILACDTADCLHDNETPTV